METTERLEISCGPEVVLDWLTMTLTGHLKAMKRPARDIIAFGIGLPGPVEGTGMARLINLQLCFSASTKTSTRSVP
ncbi:MULTISPECIES: hypothetical protein [unclassified Pseudarthrobacter]|uniref:hypothetical protein n=1 Tax=unclassified Pseudarthrobacter TaxID=2647000 RepID=UPI003078358B